MNNQQNINIVNIIHIRGNSLDFILRAQLLNNSPGRLRRLPLPAHHLGHIGADVITHYRQRTHYTNSGFLTGNCGVYRRAYVILDKILPVRRKELYNLFNAELRLHDQAEEKVFLFGYGKPRQAIPQCLELILGKRPWVDYLQINHPIGRDDIFFE